VEDNASSSNKRTRDDADDVEEKPEEKKAKADAVDA
jgi:hypothetical protein